MRYQHLPHLQMLSHKTGTVSENNVYKANCKFLKRHFRTNNTLMLLVFYEYWQKFELTECGKATLQIVKTAVLNVTVLDIFEIHVFPTHSW
jgi:hypothetical protein